MQRCQERKEEAYEILTLGKQIRKQTSRQTGKQASKQSITQTTNQPMEQPNKSASRLLRNKKNFTYFNPIIK